MSNDKIDEMDLEEIIYNLVLHGGNARAEAYEALEAAEEGRFDDAKKHLEKADEEFYEGHDYQNKLVQGKQSQVPNFLVVHAQDQLMTALAEKNLISRLINLYKRVYDLENK
jgi:PTS system cellobiose-specific IIA component